MIVAVHERNYNLSGRDLIERHLRFVLLDRVSVPSTINNAGYIRCLRRNSPSNYYG